MPRSEIGDRKFKFERLRGYYGWVQIVVSVATFVIVFSMTWWQTILACALLVGGTLLLSHYDTRRVLAGEMIAGWKPVLKYTMPKLRRMIREELRREYDGLHEADRKRGKKGKTQTPR